MDKRQRILLIDNYDSFTYNLVQQFEEAGADQVWVVNRDQLDSIRYEEYDKVVISPGPGLPREAPQLTEAIKNIPSNISVLGVCLGHQAIAETFGGSLSQLPFVQHGISSEVDIIKGDEMWHGLGEKLEVGRYHSWIIDNDSMPNDLEITAKTKDGLIMAIRHRKMNIRGVQFHPESIITPRGKKMIKNWLTWC